jgi:hypothetical protein
VVAVLFGSHCVVWWFWRSVGNKCEATSYLPHLIVTTMWTQYLQRPTTRAALIWIGSSYATVGAIGRLWTAPLRLQTTDSATCFSAIIPPTGNTRGQPCIRGTAAWHLACTHFHATCSVPFSDRYRRRGCHLGVDFWRVHRSF